MFIVKQRTRNLEGRLRRRNQRSRRKLGGLTPERESVIKQKEWSLVPHAAKSPRKEVATHAADLQTEVLEDLNITCYIGPWSTK